MSTAHVTHGALMESHEGLYRREVPGMKRRYFKFFDLHSLYPSLTLQVSLHYTVLSILYRNSCRGVKLKCSLFSFMVAAIPEETALYWSGEESASV